MPLDLPQLVSRLAKRDQYRTEADIQSDIQTLLLHSGLNLHDQQVHLESQLQDGSRRRIDVETGSTVIEVKKSLVNADAVREFERQLAGYVRTRSKQTGGRYVGILTDGAEWRLYSDHGGTFSQVTALTITAKDPDGADRLVAWLEAVMATAEKIKPTPDAIRDKLGETSPSFALDIAELTALYEACQDLPEVKLKRSLWAKLLTTALGTAFKNDTELFIQHTYLVLVAETVAHAVVGFDLSDASLSPATIVSGAAFSQSQITGVVEQDFFDWPLVPPGGPKFITRLARHVARFDWSEPEHDVLKHLYESVISPETRHALGEYYTADWMADRLVREVVTAPLSQRVLDPSCGSGTFVFHAVRNFLAAADDAGIPSHQALRQVTNAVTGMDLHPVAVTLARVTYLLALGTRRIQDPSREPLAVPIYLGDSLQWDRDRQALTQGELVVPTGEGSSLFSRELRFPERVTQDATTFDRLVERLSELATSRKPGSAIPSLKPVFAHFAVHPDDQSELTETFTIMCQLVDEGRDHVWGYYVRNVARPLWLTRPENHVDALIGNPPWLSYRYMPKDMQKQFEAESKARGLWEGGKVATHQDLSAYFVARACELYLKPGGLFGFVMPFAVLSRIQYEGFRSGVLVPKGSDDFSGKSRMDSRSPALSFDAPWDFSRIKPSPFPVPSSAVFGTFTPGRAVPMPAATLEWTGRMPTVMLDWDTAKGFLAAHEGHVQVADSDAETSPYKERFTNGATLYPRLLLFVKEKVGGPLGAGAGRVSVGSARNNQEKEPWKSVPSIEGVVERQFVYPALMGSSIAPYRVISAEQVVLPHLKGMMLSADGDPAPIDHYPGMANWYRQAIDRWEANKSGSMTLEERWDFQRGITKQYPAAPYRVVYTKSGTILASAVVTDERAIVENTLYWANCSSLPEARYLTGILNSTPLLEAVKGLQSVGQFGARHFDLYVFRARFDIYDPTDAHHTGLVSLVERAERVAADVTVDEAKSFQTARKAIRQALLADGVATDIDAAVAEIIN